MLLVQIVRTVKQKCPQTPLVLYINGNGGLLEKMKGTGVDVIGLDWTVDMADGRRRLGSDIGIQGNVDPASLFSPLPTITDEIKRFEETQLILKFLIIPHSMYSITSLTNAYRKSKIHLLTESDDCISKLIRWPWLYRVVNSAGRKGHILNLGHGVLVGTPEEAVAHFFDVAKSLDFDSTLKNYAVEEPNMVA